MMLKFSLLVVSAFLKKTVLFNMQNKKQYKIGVLLSAYNGEKYIAQQIDSIMNQTVKNNLTLIVRNDGSTDNTIKILDKIKHKYSNLRVINGNNLGLINSFFKLLEIALKEYDFDYFSFSDQDDFWKEDKLESAIKFLNRENQDIPLLYGCRSLVVDEHLNTTGYKTQAMQRNIDFFNTTIQNIIPGHNQVMNKKLAQLVVSKRINPSKVYSQDLWITNVAAVSGKILFDNIPHTYYRMHGDNQLGYGNSKINRVLSHITRLRKNEAKKMAIQLKYFGESFTEFLSWEQINELKLFFASQNSLANRLKYVQHTNMYRQDEKETLLFKLLYLMGKYNI